MKKEIIAFKLSPLEIKILSKMDFSSIEAFLNLFLLYGMKLWYGVYFNVYSAVKYLPLEMNFQFSKEVINS